MLFSFNFNKNVLSIFACCALQQQVALLRQLQTELKQERAAGLLVEARVREEISREFSDLFSEMQIDFK